MLTLDLSAIQERREQLLEHYRRLVGELLEHGWIDHEGTELAVADFLEGNDRAGEILRTLIDLQGEALADSRRAGAEPC